MVKEGYWYGLPLGLVAIGCAALGLLWEAALFLILTAFVLNFFRDPERTIPSDPAAIVSPADGRVVEIAEEDYDGRRVRRISIFMSPVDVHVNRAPAAGELRDIVYRKGRFLVASGPRASVENEQNVFTVETEAGPIVVKQIAGLVARRIVFWKRVGERLSRGERVGLIKFGSRVDVLLDPAIELSVRTGDRVRAGSTVLARAPGRDMGAAQAAQARGAAPPDRG
ncbi:MAG TPA: phosphatidylserine decarboxylase family protein [Terriglobia bacterium]|jgi:phosphatidylserine decarboxylase|nr:phosphatidylserine decarboxylase family protein [Terriglobia bacterium]